MKRIVLSTALAGVLSLGLGAPAFAGPGPTPPPVQTCKGTGWVDVNLCTPRSGGPIIARTRLQPYEMRCAVRYRFDPTVYRTNPMCVPFAQFLVRGSDGNAAAKHR